MKRQSRYATMTASDLARETRERGLDKPNVITLSEWADFLEADDVKRAQQPADAEADTEPAPAKTDAEDKPAKKEAK